MRQKSFIISIFVTLFILGIVAGVARAAYFAQQPPADEAAQLKQTLSVREAQYKQTISEANTRLEQANQALQQMQQQLDTQQTYVSQPAAADTVPQEAVSAAAPQSAVSSEKASEIALTAANNWAELDSKSQTELVDYQGKGAYEVKLSDGGNMYIDSQDGSLLFNSLTGSDKTVITEDQAAKAAQAYLKGGGVFSVQRSLYNGKPAYRVLFDVGHRIYVGLGGDILYVELHQLVASSGGGGGGGASAPAPSHHEDDEGGGDD
jgi:hypothetical protein